MTERTTVLEITQLSKAFAGLEVLCGLDLTLAAGSRLGLIGANGSGKSTLLGVIAGTVPHDAGAVRLAGADIGGSPAWRRAALGIGRTFQESRLWPDLTPREHIAVVRHRLRQVPGVEARYVALRGLMGLDAEPGDMECAGMRLFDRRRLELLLAALVGHRLLLVDEVGAGLDRDEAGNLYQAIVAFVAAGLVRCAILVEHRLDVVGAHASELALIEGGRIAERTDPAQADRLFRRLFDGSSPTTPERSPHDLTRKRHDGSSRNDA